VTGGTGLGEISIATRHGSLIFLLKTLIFFEFRIQEKNDSLTKQCVYLKKRIALAMTIFEKKENGYYKLTGNFYNNEIRKENKVLQKSKMSSPACIICHDVRQYYIH